MLLYGKSNVIPMINNLLDCQIFNFSSSIEGYENLHMYPPFELGRMCEMEFDIAYTNYILSNDYTFFKLMTIVELLYSGKNVFLITSSLNNDWVELFTESFLKILQTRYGISAVKIETIEDIQYADTNDSVINDPTFVSVYDMDMIRLEYMRMSDAIETGKVKIVVDD